MSSRGAAAVVALVAVAAVGCSEEVPSGPAPLPRQQGSLPAPAAQEQDFERYVALGDSFTAGPLVPTTDLAGGCFRSDGNYPALLGEMLDVEVVDVSCSGASTRDLVRPQRPVPNAVVDPQLDAVDRRTDLVTLGIGGNDFDLFSTLVHTCTGLGSEDPTGSPCFESLERRGVDLVERTRQIGERVARAVREVQQRAPKATVVVVGYLRLLPPSGSCPPALPLAAGDAQRGDRVARALNAALGDAARRTGALFADMYAASEGHDVCSEEPWVNGRRTDEEAALAYHPFAAGMEATAEAIADRLDG